MIRKLLFTLGIILTANLLVFSQSTGTLKGKIVDKETKEPIPFANVIIEQNGVQAGGATSDIEGNYTIKPINPGKYDVKSSFVGYQPQVTRGFIVGAGKIEFLNINMTSSATQLDVVEVFDYKVPLISKDETTSGATITSEQIDKMPNRSANAVAASVGGVFSADGERGSVRGAREGATVTYIDGIKVIGSSSLPPSAIEQVSVMISGLPAQYGDATSGVINVTTKGPSREFGGGLEIQTSEFLDAFGYNRLGFNAQGPIWMRGDSNKRESVVGFFVAGEVLSTKDNNRSAIGRWKVKDDVLTQLKQNPLMYTGLGFGTFNTANFIRLSDMENVDASQNNERLSVNLSGKIDIKPSKTTNVTLGGTYNLDQGNDFSYGFSLFNFENNPFSKDETWRVYGRFTQRFPVDPESKSLIKNVYYSLQADYSRRSGFQQNDNHKDDFFKYGHLGKYDTYTTRSYELKNKVTVNGVDYYNVWEHNGYRDTLVAFTPSEFNPDMARYTSQYYELYPESIFHQNFDFIQLGGGLLNGETVDAVNSLWTAPGVQWGNYNKYEIDQLGFNATFSADIKNHEVQFGLQYEQRAERGFGIGARQLWTHMRNLANFHINELDLSNPHMVYDGNVFMDTVYYDRRYDAGSQRTFDVRLRQKLGLPVDGTDYINIDSYDFNSRTISYYDNNGMLKNISLGEDLFDLSLFSADDLLNSGNSYVNYYGYDYMGNKLTGKPSLDDFLNKTDDNGVFLREIGAFEPIYMAGYIQDKFAFNDLIFNIGLRVDRYDGNQLVLADPYSLYPTLSVDEVSEVGGVPVNHPGNMGSEYVVYVDNASSPTKIMGYRNGSQWYNANGVAIANPTALDGGSGVTPYMLTDDPDFGKVTAKSFKDYEPQWSVMPRISFSFPISEEALFYAHYDILTQRPTSDERFNILDYYYFNEIDGNINNPNLKPTKTIDYELGFRQKISNTSALTLTAYYKELRDDIQVYRFSGAYPREYNSYNNIDFGTVKGFTVSYDLRRTGNVTLRASYTLQFADATGSGTTTAQALIASGVPNLRSTNPVAWDRRHAVNLSVDYRFGEGKEYDGPRLRKNHETKAPIDLLKNTGINFVVTGGSGTPYTRSSNVTSRIVSTNNLLKGTYFGSRLPWQFRVDAKLDRDIEIKWGKGEGKRRVSTLNLYVQVNNIFGTENVMGVWAATGNPDDDGYLAAAEWQRQINQQLSPESFRDMYSIFVNNPGNYSSPRTIRVGAIFNF